MRVPLQVVKELAWGPKATKRPKTTSGNQTQERWSLYNPAQKHPQERQRGEH